MCSRLVEKGEWFWRRPKDGLTLRSNFRRIWGIWARFWIFLGCKVSKDDPILYIGTFLTLLLAQEELRLLPSLKLP
jgi:hypothetical protein